MKNMRAMMKINNILCLGAFLLTLFSCETLSIDEKVVSQPVISSFSPEAAPVGAEVIINGEFLNDVIEATVGGVPVTIVEKVSDTRLSISIGPDVKGGKIALRNNSGTGVSEKEFTCAFAVPELSAANVPASAEMGTQILLTGKNLNSARTVEFTSEGHSPHEAAISERSDKEIVIKVPYVETDKAKITLTYFDGNKIVSTDIASAPETNVIKYTPTFDNLEFERAEAGSKIVLKGKYLNNVESVSFGDTQAEFIATPEELTVTVPMGEYPDGTTLVSLKVSYFEGNESKTIVEKFELYVPFIKVWKDNTTVCQARWEESPFTAFFSPETGKVYENSKWETEVDPVAVKYKNTQWGSANMPKPGVVSDEEYNSSIPYFFFSAGSDLAVTIQSPANSNGQLKNIYTENNSNSSITGKNSWTGTPILEFILLDKDSENPAESALYQKVVSGNLEKIDSETFPIDLAANTICGIAVTGENMKGAFNSWHKSYKGWYPAHKDITSDTPGCEVDAVMIVAWYTNCGYSAESPLANIKRLGVLHIKSADWGIRPDNGRFEKSFVNFDCYWMKYDYTYPSL